METVLVVDDSEQARNVAGSCLREHGMVPMFAKNGREALEVIETHSLDAVLTDLHMPEMGGLRLVEHLRRVHSRIPVVLMTGRGSEQDAVAALRAGALSYVPKKDLKRDLCDAMMIVVAAVEANRYRERMRVLLQNSESHFTLGFELDATSSVVSHLQSNLSQINFADETGLFQLSTALGESINNAIDHGNLELSSAMREENVGAYAGLRQDRSTQAPYCDRCVHISERLTPDAVTYVVRDEGRGFDHSEVPDPRDPENLLKASGRGLMLIRTFMDEVTFNDSGNEITMLKRRPDR